MLPVIAFVRAVHLNAKLATKVSSAVGAFSLYQNTVVLARAFGRFSLVGECLEARGSVVLRRGLTGSGLGQYLPELCAPLRWSL